MATTKLLSDEKMRELGFIDNLPEKWYYCKRVGAATTLNITIMKSDGSWEEAVIDEYFGQHAYYFSAKPEFKAEVIKNVDEQIAVLREAGLDVNVVHEEYSSGE